MQPRISIIIPIYNTELYLRDCLESIVNQTLGEIEIICVVNGSTDNSLSIVKEFAAADSRIMLIELDIADIGTARNTGVRAATGEYLMFVDADDWIKLEACGKLYGTAKSNDLDILQGLHQQEPHRFVEFFRCKKKMFNIISTGMHFWQNNYNISAANWDKIWKRDFFIENKLFNPEGVFYEDNMTSIRGMLSSRRFMTINYRFYHYRCVETSITHTNITEKHIFSYRILTEQLKIFIKDNGLYNNKFFVTYYFKSLFIYYARFQKNRTSEMVEKLGEIDKKLISSFPLKIKLSSYLPLTASKVYKLWIKRETIRCIITKLRTQSKQKKHRVDTKINSHTF